METVLTAPALAVLEYFTDRIAYANTRSERYMILNQATAILAILVEGQMLEKEVVKIALADAVKRPCTDVGDEGFNAMVKREENGNALFTCAYSDLNCCL